MKIAFTLNGERRELESSPWRRLIDVLRLDWRLTGTKEGCGEGECGACTVLFDGEPANACLIPVGQAHGHAVETVEGLCAGDILHAVQASLLEHGGTQCGICTPGIVMTLFEATYRADLDAPFIGPASVFGRGIADEAAPDTVGDPAPVVVAPQGPQLIALTATPGPYWRRKDQARRFSVSLAAA